MRCAECGLYECCWRNPLGGCLNGEKIDTSVEIVTTPNTGNGPWNKGYQPADAMKALDEKIKRASERGTWDGVDVDEYMAELRGYDSIDPIVLKLKAKALVDAVERYTMGKCLRSELLIKNNELKNLLSNDRN